MSNSDWRKIQKTNFTKTSELSAFLQTPIDTNHRFPLNLPLRLAEKIEKGNPHDPLYRQFVPHPEEEKNPLGLAKDGLEETNAFCKAPKLLHKYKGRALLVTTGACGVHCRFCFRKNFPYEPSNTGYDKELAYLRASPDVHEVILSGGDPLSLSDEILQNLMHKLSLIPHVKLIRFHTRFPIGIPERVTPSFLNLLSSSPLPITFIVQVNHVRELDEEVLAAHKQISQLGIPVLSQTVLLRNVNDSVEGLKELFWTLTTNGILPYYLHQLDQVAGTHHFEVPEAEGLALMNTLRSSLPGYAVPRYVREIPHENSKTHLEKGTLVCS